MKNHTPTTLDFKGHAVRALGGFTPVNDIADTLGRDRKSVRNLIDRDPVLVGMKGEVVMTSPGGNQVVVCLPYDGILLLLAKLNAARSRSEEARTFLIDFQKWAAQTLKAVLMGEPVASPIFDRRPRLSGALLGKMKDHLGHTGTTEAMIRIWPEWFANLPGERPQGPQQVVTPSLGLVQPVQFELRQVEA